MPAKTDDQFKLLREEISEVSSKVGFIRLSVDNLEDETKITRTEIKDLKKQFENFDQKIFDWKSELFNKIDEFMKPVIDLQEEVTTMDSRMSRLEEKNPLN